MEDGYSAAPGLVGAHKMFNVLFVEKKNKGKL